MNEAKYAMKSFFQSDAVESKLAQAFFDSEVMEMVIKKFIRKRVEDDITNAVNKRTVTMFAYKIGLVDKTMTLLGRKGRENRRRTF